MRRGLVLVALALAVLAAYYWLDSVARSAPSIVAVIETVAGRSPVVAAMLLGMVVLTALYSAHLIWVLARAGVALLLVNASQRAIERDLPAWQVSGYFSRSGDFHRSTGSLAGRRSGTLPSPCWQ